MTWVKLVRWVSRGCLVFLGRSVPWVSKVHSVPRGSQALSVSEVSRESLVLQVCVGLLVLLVLLVLSVCEARLDLLVFRGSRDLTE